jgi:hypothetical protein
MTSRTGELESCGGKQPTGGVSLPPENFDGLGVAAEKISRSPRLYDHQRRVLHPKTQVSGSILQSSTNLSTWVPLATNSLVGGQLGRTNSAASSSSRTFYRAVTPP